MPFVSIHRAQNWRNASSSQQRPEGSIVGFRLFKKSEGRRVKSGRLDGAEKKILFENKKNRPYRQLAA